jgi:hypothetical protein|tara:strand:- start:308 stop:553 length:246 start_codon:yes stop_codon:yes gene_type:complete
MQQQTKPKLNIDLKNTTPVNTPDGGIIFQQGMILRKVSKFVVGSEEDALLPVPVFYDPESGKIVKDTLPPDLREEYAEFCV